MRRILSVLVLTILVPAVAEAQTRYATANIRLRSEASTSGTAIGSIPRGAAVQVQSCDHVGGTWCSVTYAGSDGYAAERYLVTARPAGSSASSSRSRSSRSRSSSAKSRRSGSPSSSGTRRRSSAADRGYYTGPRGGCYTYTSSGRKRYVDRSYCN